MGTDMVVTEVTQQVGVIRRLAREERQRRDVVLESARSALESIYDLIADLEAVGIPASISMDDPVSRSTKVVGRIVLPMFHPVDGKQADWTGDLPEACTYAFQVETGSGPLYVTYEPTNGTERADRRLYWSETYRTLTNSTQKTVTALAAHIRDMAVEREILRLGNAP